MSCVVCCQFNDVITESKSFQKGINKVRVGSKLMLLVDAVMVQIWDIKEERLQFKMMYSNKYLYFLSVEILNTTIQATVCYHMSY